MAKQMGLALKRGRFSLDDSSSAMPGADLRLLPAVGAARFSALVRVGLSVRCA